MKVCATCGEVYPESELRCRAHEAALVDWHATTDSHSQVGLVTDVDRRRVPDEIPFDVGHAAGEIRVPTVSTRGTLPVGGDTPPVELLHDTDRSPRAPRSGRVLAERYRLEQRIGVGGYGAVFDAYDLARQQRVAVKVLSPAAAESAELLTRFHREAIAASRVQHRHIVEVSDFDVDEHGTHYIVMELLDGVDLSEVIDDVGWLPPARALAIAAQCASGLAAAHGAGILHRDLKPANVFLIDGGDEADFVKIIDFGISKLTRAAGHYSDLTSASRVVGTPCYMSPEQARGEDLDGRCDVYGLGIILYEMLTGERPFVGRSAIEILTNHIEAPRIAPSTVQPGLRAHPEVDALVLRAIAARPRDRFASMEEFGAALLAGLDRLEPGAAARVLAAHPPPSDEGSAELTQVRLRERAPRRRRFGLAATVAATLATAAVLFAVLRGGGGSGAPVADAVAAEPEGAGDAPATAPAPPLVPLIVVAEPAPTAIDAAPVAAEHRVRITSSPSGADVYADGRKLGATPMEVTLTPAQVSARISVRAQGRVSRSVTVDRDDAREHVVLPARSRRGKKPAPAKVGIEEW